MNQNYGKLSGSKFSRKSYIVVIVSYSMNKTTIQISVDTLDRLKTLKRFERESYDEVINFVVDDFEDEELTNEEIGEIQEALEDIKKHGTIPIEDVAKELGVTLE